MFQKFTCNGVLRNVFIYKEKNAVMVLVVVVYDVVGTFGFHI
jgi:hypothetical protein